MNDDQAAGGLAAESLGLPLSPPRRTAAAIKGISAGIVGLVQGRSLRALGLSLSYRRDSTGWESRPHRDPGPGASRELVRRRLGLWACP